MQLKGKKRWEIAPCEEISFPMHNFVPDFLPHQENHPYKDLLSLPQAQGVRDMDLGPEELLYLPAGTWHRTQALEPSLTVNFGFKPTTPLELYLSHLQEKLASKQVWRQPISAQRDNFQTEALLAQLFKADEVGELVFNEGDFNAQLHKRLA